MNSQSPLSPAELARRAEAVHRAPAHKVLSDEELASLVDPPAELPGRAVLQAEAKLPRAMGDLDQNPIFDVPIPPERPFYGGEPVDTWIMTDEGLRRWVPLIHNFSIVKLPNGGRMIEAGNNRYRFTREQARHIARLLVEE